MTIRSFFSILSISFLIFLGSFFVLEYQNISLVFANIFQDIRWYHGADINIKKYNEALWLIKRGNLLEAKSLLVPLLNSKLEYQPEIFEIYGDVLFKTVGSTGDVIALYHRSLESGQNLRVEKKIALLEEQKNKTGSGETKNDSPVNSGSVSLSGSFARDTKRQEIERIQKNRGGYINLDATSTPDMKKKMQDVFGILNGEEVRRDW